ncbi:MAG: hypothetical protein INR73_02485 [Williamsia sp.]|nr:hypothetical protein [Williamsia sp.]
MRPLPNIIVALLLLSTGYAHAQSSELDSCNVVWKSQSRHAGESMPCGGGDVGLNVWVENGSLLFYVARSGTFDENNAFLKLGRVRIKLLPDPFGGVKFLQSLVLKDGCVKVWGSNGGISAEALVWVDVFHPVVHVEIRSSKPVRAEASYESWRYRDREHTGRANWGNSYKWAPQGDVKTGKDRIRFQDNKIVFYHRNKPGPTVFDVTVKQQGMDSVKEQLFDPLKDLTFGGQLEAKGMQPAGTFDSTYLDTDYRGWKLKSASPVRSVNISLYLHTGQIAAEKDWEAGLQQTVRNASLDVKKDQVATRQWWQQFWERSFIFIDPSKSGTDPLPRQAGRNYQLFRYMLGCNASGSYPTKFNGGLFTVDPSLTDTALRLTPDFRNWGGGTFTAQNQRLVYFPLIKSGDFDVLKPQLDYYLRLLKNAELRSQVYWGHAGACFTEQLENFGFPNPAEYGWKRPSGYDPGMEYNAWLEYEWDTVLEFCLMMLERERYAGMDVKVYLPFIESCVRFFDEHYQYLARQRGTKVLDAEGHLILYPGSAAETFKMAYNSTSTIAALQTILQRLLQLPSGYLNAEKRDQFRAMLSRVPPISFAQIDGHQVLTPARLWEHITNTSLETPQLYPVFPWGIYGVGKPGLDIALNTWRFDSNTIKKRSPVGWRQDNIFAARLGLTEEAAQLNTQKMKDGPNRFPAFWGPGYDWTPDHNWGGSGMIGLQEMLLQTDGEKIYLFPAWPRDWDVHFKLHAPYQTTVEAMVEKGKVTLLKVVPEERRKDVINKF